MTTDDAVALVRSVRRATPLMAAPGLDTAREIYLKREDVGPTSTFKWRGALCALSEYRAAGHRAIVTASTGNHGIATAWAARRLGLSCHVVVPTRSSDIKRRLVVASGSQLHVAGASLHEAVEYAAALALELQAPIFEDGASDAQLEGTGTIGLELVDAELDAVVVPLACGALAGGISRALARAGSLTKVVGVQSSAFTRLKHAWSGEPWTQPEATWTFADGLADDRIVEPAFSACRTHLQNIVAVDDNALREAMRTLYRRCGVVAEGAGAAAVAALDVHGDAIPGERVALVISGANVDDATRRELTAVERQAG